jgi:uncharacterized membrane protein HdeD (DUF308 family)
MNSILHQAAKMADEQLKRLRWALGLSGLVSILFAIAILVWPDISLFALVIVFGAYSLVRGVFGLAASLSMPSVPDRGWLILSSVAGIAVGIIVFIWTEMSALALLYVIGTYAIIFGVLTVAGAFRLPLDDSDRILVTLTGVISVLFGILMFAKPGDGALVLLALIAAYALITGVAELTIAIGGRRLFERSLNRVGAATAQLSH